MVVYRQLDVLQVVRAEHQRAATQVATELFPSANTGFPRGQWVKNLSPDAGEAGLISRLGRSPGGGNGSPLQCSCLENPMDTGAWRAAVHGVAQSRSQLSV